MLSVQCINLGLLPQYWYLAFKDRIQFNKYIPQYMPKQQSKQIRHIGSMHYPTLLLLLPAFLQSTLCYQTVHNYETPLREQVTDYIPSNIKQITSVNSTYTVSVGSITNGGISVHLTTSLDAFQAGTNDTSSQITSDNKQINLASPGPEPYLIFQTIDTDRLVSYNQMTYQQSTNGTTTTGIQFVRGSKYGIGYTFGLKTYCQLQVVYDGPAATMRIFNPDYGSVYSADAGSNQEVTVNNTDTKYNAEQSWVIFFELKDNPSTDSQKIVFKINTDLNYHWVNSTQTCSACKTGQVWNGDTWECDEPYSVSVIGAIVFFLIVLIFLTASLICASNFTKEKIEQQKNKNPYQNLNNTVY